MIRIVSNTIEELLEFTPVTHDYDLLAFFCKMNDLVLSGEISKKDITKYPIKNLQNDVKINQNDIDKANLIRKYYQQKFIMLELKGIKWKTPYRLDLLKYLTGDPCTAFSSTFPMLYKLPEFYAYDKEIDAIKSVLNNTTHNFKTEPTQLSLILLKKLFKNTTREKYNEFWFTNFTNSIYRIRLDLVNPFNNFFVERTKSEIEVSVVDSRLVKQDDFTFVSLEKWSFDN